MITFSDPTILQWDDIFTQITKAGYSLFMYNNAWVTSGPDTMTPAQIEAAVQAIINAYSLDDLKAHIKGLIEQHAKSIRDKAVASISAGEMASWPVKMREAIAYNSTHSASDAPMLGIEAQYRNVTIDSIVARVLANASALSNLEASVAGVCGKHKDAITAAPDFASIAAYDWRSGWPVI